MRFEPHTSFSIIGAGRVGVSLGVLLKRAGHRIIGASGRSSASLDRASSHIGCPSSTSFLDVIEGADAILIAVPDDVVAKVAEDLAGVQLEPGTVVLHAAGSIGLQPLVPLQTAGAQIVAAHVLQSVPDVERGIERIPGSWFGVTCDDVMRDWSQGFVEAVGGRVLWLSDEERDQYHLDAVIASNFLTVLAYLIEETGRDIAPYLPLMSGTLANLEKLGPANALTGPFARGDASTIARHLTRLGTDGAVRDAYVTLGLSALAIAEGRGSISATQVSQIKSLLEGSG
ncbi:MAG: Rossmann-like and DUF2520 domain-containing protein [Actinomycetota bacterium]|nr:DUF2520 domain-containing protein [Actinomycetota bacterium]